MHIEVLEAVGWFVDRLARHRETRGISKPLAVLDVGGRNVNGSTREIVEARLPVASWLAVDRLDDEGVDVVVDFSDCPGSRDHEIWTTAWARVYDAGPFDLSIATEVFEHDPDGWPQILANMAHLTRHGGTVVATFATEGRHRHSAVDGRLIDEGEEPYRNVPRHEFVDVVETLGTLGVVEIREAHPPHDLYFMATKVDPGATWSGGGLEVGP